MGETGLSPKSLLVLAGFRRRSLLVHLSVFIAVAVCPGVGVVAASHRMGHRNACNCQLTINATKIAAIQSNVLRAKIQQGSQKHAGH